MVDVLETVMSTVQALGTAAASDQQHPQPPEKQTTIDIEVPNKPPVDPPDVRMCT